jgi:hypothetical protein
LIPFEFNLFWCNGRKKKKKKEKKNSLLPFFITMKPSSPTKLIVLNNMMVIIFVVVIVVTFVRTVAGAEGSDILKLTRDQDHKDVLIVSGNSFAWYRIQTEETNIEEIQACIKSLDNLSSKLRQNEDIYPLKETINVLMFNLGELDKQVTLIIECTTAEYFTNVIRAKANMKKYEYSYCSNVDTRVISNWQLLVNDLSKVFQKIPYEDYHYLEQEFHTNRQMLVDLKKFVDKKLLDSTKIAMQFQDEGKTFSWSDLFHVLF